MSAPIGSAATCDALDLVDGVPVGRRVQAMLAMGWTATYMAGQLGCTRSGIQQLARMSVPFVGEELADKVRGLCAAIGMALGPSPDTRRKYRAMGYVTLMAWDDIDDPGAVPDTGSEDQVDPIAVELILAGKRPFVGAHILDRAEAVRVLKAAGASRAAIAYRLHTSGAVVASVERHLARLEAGGT